MSQERAANGQPTVLAHKIATYQDRVLHAAGQGGLAWERIIARTNPSSISEVLPSKC
jgi:hypothetical protein